MHRRITLLVLLSSLLASVFLVAYGCGGYAAPARPPFPNSPSPQTFSPPSLPPISKINGTVTISPEVRGKLEISHKFWDEGTPFPPKIEISVKNISDKSMEISCLYWKYNDIWLQVLSKDKTGRILGEPDCVALYLQPREMQKKIVELFSSDETQSYEIQVQVRNPPDIKGVYVQPLEAVGKIEINHSTQIRGDKILVVGVVKNISKETLGYSGWKNGIYYNDFWVVNIKYKDFSGSIINSYEQRVTYRLEPGESQSFQDYGIPENARSYEITVIRKTY